MPSYEITGETISGERALSRTPRCRLFFSLAIVLSALFVIGAGGAVMSSKPPSIATLLIGAAVAFGLILFCLELAVTVCQKDR